MFSTADLEVRNVPFPRKISSRECVRNLILRVQISAIHYVGDNLMLFNTIKYFYFLDSTTFRGCLGQKNVKIFVGFLWYEKTRLFGFEIY